MEVEKVAELISRSADRLAKAVELSRRDEKWWAFVATEDWNLIKLSWELRGVILKRGPGTEAEEPGLDLNAKARKQLEELLEDSDAM